MLSSCGADIEPFYNLSLYRAVSTHVMYSTCFDLKSNSGETT